MAEFTRAAKVGAMTLALAGAAYGGFRFVAPGAGTENGYRVHAYLPDVTGIAPRSRVLVSGIQVGVVDRLSLENGMARIDIRMKPEFPLFDDAAIGKRASSLIGESLIVLPPGTEGKTRIPNEGEITHYIDEPTIQSLQGQVSDILKDVKSVTAALKGSVGNDKGQEQIGQILKNLADVTEQLNETVKENRAEVREVIRNVNGIAGDSRPQIADILRNVKQVSDDVRKMTSAGDGTPGTPGGAGGKPGELTATMERVPRRRQTCTFTRGSFSVSSQRTIPPLRRQAPEKPDFGSRRAPGAGTTVPAAARQTRASPSAMATATPSAPVRVRARSATSCNTSSRTNCSSSQTSVLNSSPLRSRARRWRICSCRLENASRACRTSCPGAWMADDVALREPAGEEIATLSTIEPPSVSPLSGNRLPGDPSSDNPGLALCGLALICAVEIPVDYFSSAGTAPEGMSCASTITDPQIRYGHWGIAVLAVLSYSGFALIAILSVSLKVWADGMG